MPHRWRQPSHSPSGLRPPARPQNATRDAAIEAAQPDATRTDLEPTNGATWHGMETTGVNDTTIDRFSNDELADAFGVPAGETQPEDRIAPHVRTGSRCRP